MGSVAFSDVILRKSESSGNGAKNVETIPLTYMFGQRYQQAGKRAMSKYYMGDYKLFVGKLL